MVYRDRYICYCPPSRAIFGYLEEYNVENRYIKIYYFIFDRLDMGDQNPKELMIKETYTPKPVTYNTNLEKLLKENSEECESLSILHRMSYEKYNTRSNYINIPVIILSSAIGFITGIDLQYDQMNIILGVGSVFVGIIKSVDTYFQLAKRAESHRICSLQFSQISKKMQVELTLHRNQRMTAENMMNIIKTDIKNMQDIAPLIDDDIISIYNAKYRKYKRVKKPNFVNGLTDVVVNSNNNEYEYEYSSRNGSREASPMNEQRTDGQKQLPSHDPEYDQQLQSQRVNSGASISNQMDDDNASVDPIQPTIIPTGTMNMKTTSIRKEPELTNDSGGGIFAGTPSKSSNPLQVLQMLQQLQQPQPIVETTNNMVTSAFGQNPTNISNVISSSRPPSQPPSQPPSKPPSQPRSNDQSDIHDVIVSYNVDVNPSISPSGSNSSVPLGSIRTDDNGNQIVNT